MKMLIGGNSVEASDLQKIANFNPYTGELIGYVPSASKEDVDSAVASAERGQKVWGAMRTDEREELINTFLTLLNQESEDIAQLLCAESGKSISECRGEISIVRPIFHAYMHAANTLYGQVLPSKTECRNVNDMIITYYEPIGVCAAIAPFNYPISTMMNKVAPALCAGNAVIMKPASDTPMSIIKVAQLMLKAGIPKETVQVITGSGSKIGEWLTENPRVAMISLTGSTEVGVTLHRNASTYLQHMALELGGNDPLIIFADSDIELATDEAINGRIYNCGQICSASKRFIVEESIRDIFVQKLIAKLDIIKGGVPTDVTSIYGCMINESATDKVEQQINDTMSLGARCVYGGKRLHKTMISPTVLVDVTEEMPIANDMEVFGPVFPIISFNTEADALRIANNSHYGLSSGVITKDISKAMRIATQIKSGTCVINGTGDYRTSYHAFGGYKMSGIGREGAQATLQEFSELKSIVFRGIPTR